MLKILVITKRQYMKKDLLDDRFGRFRELPRELASKGHRVYGICLSYQYKDEGKVQDGPLEWESVNMGRLIFPGLFRFIRHASYSSCLSRTAILPFKTLLRYLGIHTI